MKKKAMNRRHRVTDTEAMGIGPPGASDKGMVSRLFLQVNNVLVIYSKEPYGWNYDSVNLNVNPIYKKKKKCMDTYLLNEL